MAGFNTYDEILAAYTQNGGGQRLHFQKTLTNISAASDPCSWWQSSGNPITGSLPSNGKANGRACSSATVGAMPYVNPASKNTFLARLGVALAGSTATGTVVLADRLADVQLSASEATGTITGCTATARLGSTSGAGSGGLIHGEVSSTTSGTASAFTFTYTNQNGSSATTPQFTVVNGNTGRGWSNTQFYVPLAAGDTGVRSIDSVTLVSGSAAGNVLWSIVRPLAYIPITGQSYFFERDYITELCSPPRIFDSTCFFLFGVQATAGANAAVGYVQLVSA